MNDSRPVTIYIELLEEGSVAFRPTLAEPLGEARYRVLATPDYDEADEVWAFPPGSIVRAELRRFSNGIGLVAVERA